MLKDMEIYYLLDIYLTNMAKNYWILLQKLLPKK